VSYPPHNGVDAFDAFAYEPVADLVSRAAGAVCALWDSRKKTFWQDTQQRELRKRRKGFHPTVTFRATDVLIQLRTSFPEYWREEHDKVLMPAVAAVAARDLNKLMRESTLANPPYTLALFTQVMASIARSDFGQAAEARARLPELVDELVRQLDSSPKPEHPFVLFHVIRALDAAWTEGVTKGPSDEDLTNRIRKLVDTIRTDTHTLLAKHHTGLASPSETVVLAFCAATLAVADGPSDGKLALAALTDSLTAQDDSGCWPLGRVVATEPDGRLEISTYEVAWVVCTTFDWLLRRALCTASESIGVELAEAVLKARRFAQRSEANITGTPIQGWSSDHPYQQPRVESWTTAIVLQFALSVEELAATLGNSLLLPVLNAQRPGRGRWPQRLVWGEVKGSSGKIWAYLEKHVIDPIEAHPRRLPSGDRQTASVLLFGPPGTSKTTIVKAVASRLDWPIVSLSPGSFVSQGLERIESQADEIFAQSEQLARVIVIFDECDELFRDRSPSVATEQTRSISAFVTAGMLPRLQDLHDRGRVLFFVCTNHVSMMDAAVIRGGRIDHRLGVGPPDDDARRKILEGTPAKEWPFGEAAMDELIAGTKRYTYTELRRVVRKLDGEANGWADQKAATAAIGEVLHDMDSTLTITSELAKQYEKDCIRYDDDN
jgi:ATPase family associated with various cellular activities (AAA)